MAASFARTTSRTSTSPSTSASPTSPDNVFCSRRFAVYEPLYLVHQHSATAATMPSLRRLSLVDKYASLSDDSTPTEPPVFSPAGPSPIEPYVFVPTDSAPFNPLAAIDARTPAPLSTRPRLPTTGVLNSTSFHSLDSLENFAPVIQVEATAADVVNYPIHLPDFGLNPRVRRMAAATAKTARLGRKAHCATKTQRTPLQRRLL